MSWAARLSLHRIKLTAISLETTGIWKDQKDQQPWFASDHAHYHTQLQKSSLWICPVLWTELCSARRYVIPWKESYDQPRQHIQKQRQYFANKGLVKAMVFPVVMYGYESWTKRKLSAKELMLWNCGVGEDS